MKNPRGIDATLRRRLLAPGLLLLAAGGILLFSRATASAAQDLVAWVSGYGPWALALYILSVAGTVVLLIPGGVLPMGGGFLFGVAKGTSLFVLGEILGAVLAFGIARLFLGPPLRRYFGANPRLAVMKASLSGEGWRIIAMTRMVPFFPFKLSNYFFGSMGVPFKAFFWGTLLGTLPLSLLLVYLGSLTASLATLDQGGFREHPWGAALLLGMGLVGIAGLAWMSRRVARAYRKRMDELDLPVQLEREG